MANNKIIPDAKDAPPITHATLQEMTERIYGLENRLDFYLSDQGAGNKGLDATTQSLSEQISALSKRIVRGTVGATVATGSLPNDATFHDYGTPVDTPITLPKGCRFVVTFGASQATISVGAVGGGVTAETIMLVCNTAGVPLLGANGSYSSRFYSSIDADTIGGPMAMTREINTVPGDYIIRTQCRAWASGTAVGTVNFTGPYNTVQITGT